jgi:hypothetical protein
MAITITAAAQGILTGSLVTLYTVPANSLFVVKALTFSNHSGIAATLIVECTQNVATQRRYIERSLNDNVADLAPELINQVFAATDIIQASGDGITYLLSGVLVSV